MSDYREERAALGRRLRALRQDAGLTGAELAERLGISQSKVSKIENGTLTPGEEELAHWASILGATVTVQAELLDQRGRVASEYRNWRTIYGGSAQRRQSEFLALEGAATLVRVFQPTLIPGLLQTAEYAQLRLAQWAELHDAGSVAEAVATRMERQRALYEPSRSFGFLILEAALRYRLCSREGMLAQLDRIASLSTLPNVAVEIVPLSAELPVAPLHPFEMLDSDLVTVETFSGENTITDPQEIRLYGAIFEMLQAVALGGDAARTLLREIVDHLRAS